MKSEHIACCLEIFLAFIESLNFFFFFFSFFFFALEYVGNIELEMWKDIEIIRALELFFFALT